MEVRRIFLPDSRRGGKGLPAIVNNIGHGNRIVVVSSVGPKWARLICPYTLRSCTLPRGEYDISISRTNHGQRKLAPRQAKRIHRTMERQARTFKRLDVAYPVRRTEEVLAGLIADGGTAL